MATSLETCGICFNSFNEADHKDVILPCNHSFCLICLVQLKSSGSQNCPVCRQDWSNIEIEILPKMEALGNRNTTGLSEKKGGEDSNYSKKPGNEVDVMCEEHSYPWLFWCDHCNQFLCKKCIVAKQKTCTFNLIEDIIPSIRASICTTANSVICDLQGEAEQMKKLHDRATKALSSLARLKDAIVEKEAELKSYIENSKTMIAKNIQDIIVVEEAVVKSGQINTICDIELMQECQQITNKHPKKCALPSQEALQSLLCDITSSYMDEAVQCLQESDTKRAAFTSCLQQYAGGSIPGGMEAVLAAEYLKADKRWLVNNENCLPALYALATRQPSDITLVAIEDCPEPLPVAAIIGAARDCSVVTRYWDSFYSPQCASTDAARLECFLANDSLTLDEFYGHLDGPGMARLPHDITVLGLAIGSEADARAVSSLAVWEDLEYLEVAVSSTVASETLLPLPIVEQTWLYFYDLTDTRVDSVRPAIEALMPDKRSYVLLLPKCHLTAAGAIRLAGLLRGAGSGEIYIDTRRIEQRDRPSVKAVFADAGVPVIGWDVAWLYE